MDDIEMSKHNNAAVPIRFDEERNRGSESGACDVIITIFSYILFIITFPIAILYAIKIVKEYERAVVFRLGRLVHGLKGPGTFFIMPFTDTFIKVDLRLVSYNVPPQEILSRDSVTVSVDAVVYYRISDATTSVVGVENASESTKLLAQTTLRTILGTHTLAQILSERESISHHMQVALDEATEPWGVKVERVELKDVRLPTNMQRAMAAEAEASREAGAKLIAAQGEFNSSKALSEAATVITNAPGAMQLRYLQTLQTISAEKNTTVIFPFPIELFGGFLNKMTGGAMGTPMPTIQQQQPSSSRYPPNDVVVPM